MTMVERYARVSGESWYDAVRRAHSQYDKTRCAAWLAATGNRPATGDGLVASGVLAKGPQIVYRSAVPHPEFGCDIHPVET